MIERKQELVQHVTNVTAPTGAGIAILGVAIDVWIAIIGLVFAAGSFGINLYYQRERNRREKEAHEIFKRNNGQV